MLTRFISAVVVLALGVLGAPLLANPSLQPVLGFEVGPGLSGGTAPPKQALYLHSNGNFYGTSPGGGAFGLGTVFQMTPTGQFGALSFSGLSGSLPGSKPTSRLVEAADGWLWGTTTEANAGNIFRLNPESGEIQIMHTFVTHEQVAIANGVAPSAGLVRDGQGYLWGTARFTTGSVTGNLTNGTLFRIHELTGEFTTRVRFGDATGNLGKNPQGELYADGAGNLWGTTASGGPLGFGTVFRYAIASNTLTTVAQFTGTNAGIKGNTAVTGLTPDGLGFLWGVASDGGLTSDNGVVFKVEMATNTVTTVIEFSNTGTSNRGYNPVGPLVNDGAGNLWGVTTNGGTSDRGTLFRISAATGVLTTVLQFASLTGANAGIINPVNGLTLDTAGNLWGFATAGGSANAWTVYRWNIAAGQLTRVATHPGTGVSYLGRAPQAGLAGSDVDDWTYGTTLEGGANGFGTLFRFNPINGSREVLVNFTGTTGAAIGSKPSGKVLLHSGGLIWGTTREGAANNFGTIWNYDPSSGVFTNVYNFTSSGGGAFPLGALIEAEDGLIWGTMNGGFEGGVFKIDPTTNAFTLVRGFSNSGGLGVLGRRPTGGLISDGSGFIWGATREGGTNGQGTIFKIEISTSEFTSVYSFASPTGNPTGDLAMDFNGDLWGTTTTTVFRFNTQTSALTNVFTAQSATFPNTELYVGTVAFLPDDQVWFLGKETSRFADNFTVTRDVAYTIDPNAVTPTAVRRLSLAEGIASTSFGPEISPVGALFAHRDGQLYGVTSAKGFTEEEGSPAGGGMIYRINDGPAVGTQPGNQGVAVSPAYASSVTNTTATLRGIVNPNDTPVTAEFEWGPTSVLGQTIAGSAPTPGALASLTQATLSALAPNTHYFYRAKATVTAGSANGEVMTFKTGAATFGVAAEIAVESPVGLPRVDNGAALELGAVLIGRNAKQAVVVRNLGQNTLNIASASITGDHAGDFVITTPLAGNTLSTDQRQGLLITFTPGAVGPRSATLTIVSDDADESSFEIPLTGEGEVQPDLVLEQPAGTEVLDGATVDFGNGAIGGTAVTRSFVIRNVGSAPLENVTVEISGPGMLDYEFGSQPAVTIAEGGSSGFSVSFLPVEGGLRTATLRIFSNEPDGGTYEVQLRGNAITAPEIVVEQPEDTELTDELNTVDFGISPIGVGVTRRFVIRNVGNAPLTGVGVSIAGQPQYQLTTPPLATIAAGASSAFVVTLTPTGAVPVIAQLDIVSNDSDESPFDITLSGEGRPPQPPTFTTQPQSQLAILGGTALFEPVVEGDSPMTFQWRKKTANIARATTWRYEIPVVKAADVGEYNLVADNPVGPAVTSNTAYLGTVTLSQGTLTLKELGTLTLTCTATKPTAPGVDLTYSWRRSGGVLANGTSGTGSVISGATTKSLKITGMRTGDAGNYTCVVTLVTPNGNASTANGDTVVNVATGKPVIAAMVLPVTSVSQPISAPAFGPVTATNFPTSFTATGLPPGVKLNAKTGELSGKPTAAKLYSVKFTATNPYGASVPLTVLWQVDGLDPTLVGTFYGLVPRHSFTNFGLGGTVQITTAGTGVVSGSVTLAGVKYPVVGTLDKTVGNDPTASLIIKRTPLALGDLILDEVTLETGGNRLSGVIRDPQFDTVESLLDIGGSGAGFENGPGETAKFDSPSGIAIRGDEGGYIADTGNQVIRAVDGNTGNVSTFVGQVGVSGSSDGSGTAARFNGPEGMALDAAGNLYVADALNGTIRKVTPEGLVSTFAGTAGDRRNLNGTGTAARFHTPTSLCFDPAGNLYVADRMDHTIRKITPVGVVTTLAGKSGLTGTINGAGAAVRFNQPQGITYDPLLKALFVADTQNFAIRKVTLTGTVTTYAGSLGASGFVSGIGGNARFAAPIAIVSDGEGTLIVADRVLRQITPGGVVSTVTDFVDEVGRTDLPVALAITPGDGNVISVDAALHGLVSHEGISASQGIGIEAHRGTWTATNSVPTDLIGNYTAGIETSQLGDAFYPQGDGYATLAVTRTGTATWAGRAADGSPLTGSTVIGPAGEVPLHVMLYKGTGSLQGPTFIEIATGDWVSEPGFDWAKTAQPISVIDRSYREGFITHEVTLTGGKYTPANQLLNFLDLAAGSENAYLEFTQGGLAQAIEQNFTITAPNGVSVPTSTTLNPDVVRLTVTPSTGLFTGSFIPGGSGVKANFAGVLSRNSASNFRRGFGHFLLPVSSAPTSLLQIGRVRLQGR